MMQWLPDFGSLALTLGSFFLALMIIVAIHEYGHYIVGRLCGIGASVFSLGFGPVLVSRTDKRGMRWQIAALPLGGYVKFFGDANAASVGAADPHAVHARNTMPGAPLWARAATVFAGPLANFLLTIFLFAGMFLWNGKGLETVTIGKLMDLPPAMQMPFEPGDELVSINGVPAAKPEDYIKAVEAVTSEQTQITYEIDRDGARITRVGPHPQPPLANSIAPRSAAYAAGMRPGDVVLAIDGTPIHNFAMVQEAVTRTQGNPMELRVWRAGEVVTLTLSPRRTDLPTPDGGFETRFLIGLTGGLVFEPATQSVGVFEAIRGGFYRLLYILRSSLSGIWHMITGAISSCNLSSPVGIAQTSGAMASQGAGSFIAFVAFLSAAVGLLNLFPIPILDGGHLAFYAYEAVVGSPPSARALNIAMAIGASIMLAFMSLAFLNDLFLCAQ